MSRIEELGEALFLAVTAENEEDHDARHTRVFELKQGMTKPEIQQAKAFGQALLAEHHAIEEAKHRLRR